MIRDMAVLGAALIILHTGIAGAKGVVREGSQPPAASHARTTAKPISATHHAAASHGAKFHRAVRAQAGTARKALIRTAATEAAPTETTVSATAVSEAAPETLRGPLPMLLTPLSYQQEQVRRMADQNGDRMFLMVDKARGKIILFENSQPVLIGPALTGQSVADSLPSYALGEKFSKLNSLDTKVTPAGRFTVTRSHDNELGNVLDLNEIRGKDWGIAIHSVYLGIPAEHRAERLRSPNDDDNHITFGCINVEPSTFRLLMQRLPTTAATPLYVLPRDETQTAVYFAPHNS